MLRLAADENIHSAVVRGLRRRLPTLDIVRVQESLPEGTPDPQLLEWAAKENRVLISNDRSTLVGFAYHRIAEGRPIFGVIATINSQSIGSTIDDILLIAEHMSEQEIQDQVVVYLPFMQ